MIPEPEQISPKQQKALNAYASLMVELRTRLDSIPILGQFEEQIHPRILVETGFLQLRFSCEIVALGCLVAHDDLKEVKAAKLQSAYQADYIISRLERLHADFFPVPHNVEILRTDPTGRNFYHYTPVSDGFMSKERLVNAYRRCGAVLHKGSLKALSKRQDDEQKLVDELHEYHSALVTLTGAHHIMTKDREWTFVCGIPASNEGDVRVLLAKAFAKNSQDRGDLLIA